jgi:UDP-3-O-[3-hydroxymyristoyl] N-acetylglucosamine deacetylase
MLQRQTTLGGSAGAEGIGLHTGAHARIRLCPAPAYTGIVFRRTDLDSFEIPAAPQYVAHVSYATALVRKGVMVGTIEHLMAALYASGIDNAVVEISSLEVPILDGSAKPFVEMINRAGKVELDASRQYLRVRKHIELTEGQKRITISPDATFHLSLTINFDHPMIGRQHRDTLVDPATFAADLAPARTFGFLEEVDELRRMGLVRGGSLENAVVLNGDRVLNEDGLRFPDEFVRHKLIDMIGDLALVGKPMLARIVAERTGHALNNALVSRLLNDREAWELVEAEQPDFALQALSAG